MSLNISCLPNPAGPLVRLEPVREGPYWSNFYAVYAYPEARSPMHSIVIKTSVVALLSYILGHDWPNQMGAYEHIWLATPPHMAQEETSYDDHGLEQELPVQPFPNNEDETALAMRILKAGGAVVDVSATIPEDDRGELNSEFHAFERTRQFILGWPMTGGVWALKLIPLPTKSEEEIMAIQRERTITLEEYRLILRGPLDFTKLKTTENMTEYCAELEALGAKFYENPADCEEVRKRGLLDPLSLSISWRLWV